MHKLFVSILLFFIPLEFFAQGYSSIKIPEAELFTIENGMSQTRVNTVFSDSYGYLWVGTSGGLSRFDGYGFNNLKHVPYDSLSLSHNFVRSIAEDENNNLWIGTNYGLNFYDSHSGKFRQILHNHGDSSSISDFQILSVFCDRRGSVWIKTENFLDRLNIKDNTISHFQVSANTYNTNPVTQNCAIVEDKNGLIWFGNNDGLYSFDPKIQSFTKFSHDPENSESLSDNEVLNIYLDKAGDLWVGTKNGLNQFNNLKGNFKRYFFTRSENLNQSVDEIYSIVEDSQGNFWLGSNKGIIVFNKRLSETSRISSLLINKALFPVGPITELLIDKSGILWMSGLQGLFKVDTKPKKFKLYDSSINSYPALSGDMISCLYKENDDLIWVGIWGLGLNILNRKTGEVESYYPENPDPAKRIQSDKLRCIYKDRTGLIWLGSTKGVEIFNPTNRTFLNFEDKFPSVYSKELDNRRILCITEDNKGDLWMGSDQGVLHFQRKVNLVSRYNKIYSNDLTAELGIVFSLSPGKENTVWIGTENGLCVYDENTDLFYRYEETGKRNDLSSKLIYSLLFDSANTLWIGTASGLNRYNPSEDNFEVLTEKDGLSNDMINVILEDSNHCLWISTNRGISKYNIENNEFINFDVTEGLQSYEFNYSAASKSEDGEMFFGGISGFNSFYPENLPVNPHRPEIVITSFAIIENKDFIEILPARDKNQIKVKYKKSFRIKFAALDFTLPGSNLFEYSMQLKGKEDHWVSLGTQNSLTFSNLHPGEYIFKVRGSNNDHTWNKNGTSLNILCIAPFWRTKFAIYSLFLITLFFIYLLIQLRTRSLRKSNRLLRDREITAKEISRQKDLLSLRNKNIEDSLNYAQRIQKAMLTTPKQFRTILSESFILHKPKDIVSGDFYWISEQEDKIFVAAADCTGHGVPGAFMSLISLELFRKIIKTEKVYNPAVILDSMNKNFEEIFGNVEDIAIKDGMDLTLCVFDKSMKKLQFSGAFNPIYIVRDNNLIELKGDRFSIGAEIGDGFPEKVFTNHTFLLQPGDMIYMFSDGYADQFGGVDGKKYKYRRFRHLLLIIHQLNLEKQQVILDDNIEKWRGDSEQVDDILVIGIRVN